MQVSCLGLNRRCWYKSKSKNGYIIIQYPKPANTKHRVAVWHSSERVLRIVMSCYAD